MDEQEVSVEQADAALDGRLLGLGESFKGLPLGDVTEKTIVSGYGPASTREPTRATGVEIVYGGPIDPGLGHDYVRLQEALEPLMLYSYRFTFQGQAPHQGSLAVATSDVYDATQPGAPSRRAGTVFAGYLLDKGVYVTIEATSKPLLLEAARTLQEVTEP